MNEPRVFYSESVFRTDAPIELACQTVLRVLALEGAGCELGTLLSSVLQVGTTFTLIPLPNAERVMIRTMSLDSLPWEGAIEIEEPPHVVPTGSAAPPPAAPAAPSSSETADAGAVGPSTVANIQTASSAPQRPTVIQVGTPRHLMAITPLEVMPKPRPVEDPEEVAQRMAKVGRVIS